MVDGTAVWFGTAGFEVLALVDDGVELVVDVETTAAVVGCSDCGTRAVPKDRRWVTLRDVPAGCRFVRLRWRKCIWACPEPDCETKTWTEQSDLAQPRRLLTTRATEWATDRMQALEGTPASIARGFGVSWSTVWSAVERVGTQRVDDVDRVGPASMVGFDETVMSPASRRRRRRFVTAVVDVGTGQLLDVFEGRDAKDLRAWVDGMPAAWLAMIAVVSVDPHEGYRGGVIKPNPITGRPSPLAGVTIVVDPFHIVRLANDAVTRCRQRVQQDTVGHRGWKGDPLYGVRKVLLLGAERLDERGWQRLHAALDAGDPDDAIRDCWGRQGEGEGHVSDRRSCRRRRPPRRRHRLVHRSGVGPRAASPGQAPAALADRDTRSSQHRRIQRSGGGDEPVDQAGEASGAGFPQLQDSPPTHPPRRRTTTVRDSVSHEHPYSPSQVRRVAG